MNVFARRALTALGSAGALLGAASAMQAASPPPQPSQHAQEAISAQLKTQEKTQAQLQRVQGSTFAAVADASRSIQTLQGNLVADQLQAKLRAAQSSAATVTSAPPVVQSVSGASGGGDDGGGGDD